MSVRTDRLRGQIRKEIGAMLVQGEVHDPRLSPLVSISDVRLSRDMQHATVFFLVAGAEAQAETLAALGSASGYIRGLLGRRIDMRRVPHLRFQADTSMDQGEKIDRLLRSIDIPPPEADPESRALPDAENTEND